MKREHRVVIAEEECKGCRLCVQQCPNHCLVIGSAINSHGYQYARFDGGACTGCGFCFYVCPEPGAITVLPVEVTP
jgi:Pyruvate/2-oxoacid:ferredoxin oxidoreductase delta subunit